MKDLSSTSLRRRGRGWRRRTLWRAVRNTLYVKLGFALVLLTAAGLGYLRLVAGPMSFAGLPERVAEAMAERIGPGWSVTLRNSSIGLEGGNLALRTLDLEIRNPAGVVVVQAPDATVRVDPGSLVSGRVQPRGIELRDLQLRAVIAPDGTVSFIPQGEAGAPPRAAAAVIAPLESPGEAAVPRSELLGPSHVSTAVAGLIEMVLDRTAVIGALDRAAITNARLTLVDTNRRERASYDRVNATFERLPGKLRRFDLRLAGARGEWGIAGDVRPLEEGRRVAKVTVSSLPLQDLMLLSGYSALPASAELKLDGTIEAGLSGDRLERLDADLTAGPGTVKIEDRDMPAIPVDRLHLGLAWNEAERHFTIGSARFEGGASRLAATGRIALPGDGSWHVSLAGSDALLSGATAGDAPVALSSFALEASGQEQGARIDRLSVRGPTLSAEGSGAFGLIGGREALQVVVKARGTAVRSALRLWPPAVAPPPRAYLAEHLRGGILDELDLTVDLTTADLKRAVHQQPIPDASVRVSFVLREAELLVGKDLPPLSQASASGLVTGTRAEVRVARARLAASDGRGLTALDGQFSVPDLWARDTIARIALRLEGGADGLAALLQSPGLRSAAGIDLDPGTLRGRVDLKAALSLSLDHPPAVAELPLTVNGTLSEVSLDKVFGRERLEGATLGLSYDRGALTLKGEGRIGGTPATLELRQPRGAPGEAIVTAALDDAARARRGFNLGPQLSGTVPVRIVAPLAKGLKTCRVEFDLTRAAVDNLLPGWSKAAGRPAKASFILRDEGSVELDELVIESGAFSLRGSAALTSDGQFKSADLSTLKVSAGDDLKGTVERANGVYRVALKGNTFDARPLIKGFSSGGAGAGKEGKDVDLELNVNILTGHNDEALTGAAVKASLRRGDLRNLQLTGRFRNARVSARVGQGERVNMPVLTLASEDAGALLRFADIYKRMVGGALRLTMSLGEGPQVGSVLVQSFSLRNEPALKNIVAQQPALNDDRGAAAPRFDVNDAAFVRLKADFTRSGGRLDFRDAVIWGSQVGFTLGGFIDYARDRADIAGTFVPAFQINNAFAQLPMVGPILGGGRDEGLFAVNFRISGPASAPTLTVNPLSAVAPGFLRKLFGTGRATEPAPEFPDR